MLLVLATSVGGCAWLDKMNWPWRKKSVPITRAKWVDDKGWPVLTTRPGAPVARPPARAPATRPARRSDEPLRVLGRPTEITASVLKVKNTFITIEEVVQGAETRLRSIPDGLAEAGFRRRAREICAAEISRRVNDALVLAEANARLSEENKEQIEEKVKNIRSRMIADAGGSAKKLQLALVAKGTTLDDILDDHRHRLTVQLYQQVKFLPAVAVNRTMMLEYYNAHVDEFRKDQKVQMQIIAAPFKAYLADDVAGKPSQVEMSAAKRRAKVVIELARRRLADGKDFGETAKQMSLGIKAADGGVWPMMAAGSFRETEVEKAAFALAEGKTGGIIETATGYYIVKARKVVKGSRVSFEDAQERIMEILRARQFEKLTLEFRKRLAEEAAVGRDPKFLRAAADRAVQLHWKP